jgi:hypothetical protein
MRARVDFLSMAPRGGHPFARGYSPGSAPSPAPYIKRHHLAGKSSKGRTDLAQQKRLFGERVVPCQLICPEYLSDRISIVYDPEFPLSTSRPIGNIRLTAAECNCQAGLQC